MIEKAILNHLSHKTMDNLNGSFATVLCRFQQFVFSSLLMRVSPTKHEASTSESSLRLFQFIREIKDLASGIICISQKTR